MGFNSGEFGSGLAASLLGLIVLVIVGLAVSIWADQRIDTSNELSRHQRDLISGKEEITTLKLRHQQLKLQLDTALPKRDSWLSQLQSLPTLETMIARRKEITATISNLQKQIDALDAEFQAYRSRLRTQAQEHAIGMKLPQLKTRSGRIYKNVLIRDVTNQGFIIRHDHGSARIDADDLIPADLQRIFPDPATSFPKSR